MVELNRTNGVKNRLLYADNENRLEWILLKISQILEITQIEWLLCEWANCLVNS